MVMSESKKQRTCRECGWWNQGELPQSGKCRFNAPAPAGFPVTLGGDWCRQWCSTTGMATDWDVQDPPVEVHDILDDGFGLSPMERPEVVEARERKNAELRRYVDEVVSGPYGYPVKAVRITPAQRDVDGFQVPTAEQTLELQDRRAAELTRDLDHAMPWRRAREIHSARLSGIFGEPCPVCGAQNVEPCHD